MKTITDHELSEIANDWAGGIPYENIGIRSAFAAGYRLAEQQANGTNSDNGKLSISHVSNSLPDLLGLDNPSYPLKYVIDRLKWATERLLKKYNYDGHNYEELEQCVRRADGILSILEGNFS